MSLTGTRRPELNQLLSPDKLLRVCRAMSSGLLSPAFCAAAGQNGLRTYVYFSFDASVPQRFP
jgi:hypothetical protein